MSWEDNVHLVPTRNEPLLRAMLGQSIQSMAHYAEGGSEALLAHEAYAMRNIMPRQLFSLANSQVVLRLGNGEALEFGSLEELASLTVEHANEKVLREYDLYPIEATDPTYSEPVFARALGRRIVAIRVLRFEVRSTPTHVMSPALEDRPREAGVVLELDDGSALLISHTMLEAPNDLGIFPAEQLVNTKLSYKEVLHLRAEPVKTSLRRVGFFRELRHGKADGPVLKEAIRGAGDPDEPKVVSYLRAGHVLMASPGIVRDVLDPRGGIIGALGILTDGTYAWPSDLVHYVERYHARLPDELIAHMASLGWRMPDHVDLSALQLFP